MKYTGTICASVRRFDNGKYTNALGSESRRELFSGWGIGDAEKTGSMSRFDTAHTASTRSISTWGTCLYFKYFGARHCGYCQYSQ